VEDTPIQSVSCYSANTNTERARRTYRAMPLPARLVMFGLSNMTSGVMFGFANVRDLSEKYLSAIVMRSFRDNLLVRMRADPRACLSHATCLAHG